jgi:hypothetical protein
MAGCYHCGTALGKGQGVRRNVRTGTSVAGLSPLPPSFFVFTVAALLGIKVPSTRSYFGLRSLCVPCAQRLDAQRARWRKIFLALVIVAAVVLVVMTAMR